MDRIKLTDRYWRKINSKKFSAMNCYKKRIDIKKTKDGWFIEYGNITSALFYKTAIDAASACPNFLVLSNNKEWKNFIENE
jgi:hypothetical protein